MWWGPVASCIEARGVVSHAGTTDDDLLGGLLLVGAVVVSVLTFSFVLVLVLLNMAQRRRGWEHAEHLKALEMRQTISERVSDWARAWVCIAIGAGVPIGAFLFTGLATLLQKVDSGIWWAPGVVGTTAVYYGYCLATKLFGSSDEADDDEADNDGKPAIDADALDVVSRRGG
jgi:hypothetical protein